MQDMRPRLRGSIYKDTFSVRPGKEAHSHTENKLNTHDVNMPLPNSRYLRFILLSCVDGDAADKHQRVERLYHQSGGREAAIIWLLDEGGNPSSLMGFQIE